MLRATGKLNVSRREEHFGFKGAGRLTSPGSLTWKEVTVLDWPGLLRDHLISYAVGSRGSAEVQHSGAHVPAAMIKLLSIPTAVSFSFFFFLIFFPFILFYF